MDVASPGPTDAALLGDLARPADTFSVFYRRHARGVLAFCARQGLSAADAADATADTFVAALTSRHRFADDHAGSAMAWLYGIASHVVIGRHHRSARERGTHEQLQLHPSVPTDADVADYADLRDAAARALAHIDELPAPQRDAVLQRHLGNATYPELAERHGISEQVARQRVSRALATVRERMASA